MTGPRPDMAAIKARAEAATPGPWRTEQVIGFDGSDIFWPDDGMPMATAFCSVDAEHIAGMDPPTTLALVAEVERLTAVVAEVRALVAQRDERGATWVVRRVSALTPDAES